MVTRVAVAGFWYPICGRSWPPSNPPSRRRGAPSPCRRRRRRPRRCTRPRPRRRWPPRPRPASRAGGAAPARGRRCRPGPTGSNGSTSTRGLRLFTGWPTSTSRSPSSSRSPIAADSTLAWPGWVTGTLRVLSLHRSGDRAANPKIPISAPPSEVTTSSGGTPAWVPLRSPTASGPCTGRGVAHEQTGIELVADAQLAAEAAHRMLEDEQRSRVAVGAPHQREHVQRPGTEVLRDAQVERLGVGQRARPVPGEAHDVRRAGHVGVEVSVRQQAVARRRTGHVTERDVHRETGTGRAGSVRLHRGERPVTVVEQHADAAGCRQRNHDVLAVLPVEVSDRDRLRWPPASRCRCARSSPRRWPRRPARNPHEHRSQEQRKRPANDDPGAVDG